METNGNVESGSDRRARKQHFVLAQGDAPAAEIVKRAKGKGIKLSASYVYYVRSTSKSKPLKSRAPDMETRFLDCVLDLGIARAEELLQKIRTAATTVASTNQ